MGLPPERRYIDYLMEHEIDRMILSVPNEDPEIAEDYISKYARAIEEFI